MKRGFKLTITSILTTSLVVTSSGLTLAQSYNPSYATTPGATYNLNQQYQPQSTNQQYQPQPTNQQYQPQPVNQQYNSYPSNQYTPATSTYNNNGSYIPPLQGRVITVPAGSNIPAVATSIITSERAMTGDAVSLVLSNHFYFNGILIAPANSMINGNVVIAEKAGRAGKHGKLKINFTNIITPSGQRIPISGKVRTEDNSGLLVGGTTKDRAIGVAKDVGIGAGLGALSGLVFGSMSGGKAGRGTALGTAVGAGLGGAKTIIGKGNDVILDRNTPIDIILDRPATVTPSQPY